jgi:outer membrane protein insertion porin family
MRNSTRFLVKLLTVFAFLAAVPSASIVAVSAVSSAAYAQSNRTVQNIDVQGNRRVETETVVGYLRLGVGDRYDSVRADDSFKALFATGLFSDVKISLQGSTLLVELVENPIINRVAFEGNRKVTNDTLEAEVQLRPRIVFTRSRVTADVQRILTIYRRSGRFDARVEPKIIQLPQNRVDLVFEIDEGDKTKVSRINFVGNRAFSDSDLQEEITTSESGLLSFLRSDDIYDPDRLAADQELLRRFYLNQGYADFRVVSAVADLDRDNNSFFITITVDEGALYFFGEVVVESTINGLDPDELRAVVLTRPGDNYSLANIDKTLEDITLEVSKLGFAFAQVRPQGRRDPDTKLISIVYVVEEASAIYIERINITGNTRTLDEVVRREFDVDEGDAYNRVLIDRAERRLNSLDYFEKVTISRSPGSAPDRVIVNVEVIDKSTGSLSVGAGFSTQDGVLGDISITERNFLGRGNFVRLAASISGKRQDIDFSFTDPYFMDRRISAGIDIFSRQVDLEDESSFNLERHGGGLRFGFPITENWSLTTRYQFSLEKITDVQASSSIAVFQAQGNSNASTVGYTIRFDTLDSSRNPTTGLYFTFTQDIAGLGGDVNYLRTTAEARAYYEFRPGIVGLVKLQGGHITGLGSDNVRLLDAFFKGGETIRGFDRSGLGPRDMVSGDALGGNIYFAATAEIQFPVPFLPEGLGFKGAVFVDAGSVYNTDLVTGTTFDRDGSGAIDLANETLIVQDSSSIRSSVGVSIIWNSPFGPLRADLAQVLSSSTFDDEQVFRFGGGTQF